MMDELVACLYVGGTGAGKYKRGAAHDVLAQHLAGVRAFQGHPLPQFLPILRMHLGSSS